MPFEKAFLGITNSMIPLIPILHAYIIRERERESILISIWGVHLALFVLGRVWSVIQNFVCFELDTPSVGDQPQILHEILGFGLDVCFIEGCDLSCACE